MYKQVFLSRKESGPKILVISGIHGDESQAVVSVLKLADAISKLSCDPSSVFSHVASYTFLHAVNDFGLAQHTRENLYQKESETPQDLNRLFKAEFSTPTELKDTISTAITDADIVIDVHNSPLCKNCFLVDYDSNADKILSLVGRTSLTPLVRTVNTNAGTVKSKALSMGKIGFTVELNGMGFLGDDPEQSSILLLEFIQSILSNYNLPKKTCPDLSEYLSHSLYSMITGVVSWQRLNPWLKKYSKNEVICTVTSLDGKETHEIKAPYSGGFVYDITHFYYVNKGEPIVEYARNPQDFFGKE